jgi:hypothetical protein
MFLIETFNIEMYLLVGEKEGAGLTVGSEQSIF